MSWQPTMYIPRNSRMSGRTWLISVLAPLVALLVAYLVALVSLLAAPSGQELLEASGEPMGGTAFPSDISDMVDGVPNTPLIALILLTMGLIAPAKATVSVITEFGFPLPIQMSVLAVPLTLTVLMGIVVFVMHRRNCRRVSQSPLLLWLPAVISALVLAGAALILVQFTSTRITLNLPEEAGVSEIYGINMTSQLDIVWLVPAALAIGLIATLLGRLNAIPARRNTYTSTSLPNHTPSIAHALRVSFGVLLFSVLATGIYMTIYALVKMEDGVPLRIAFYALPYLINLGLVTTLSSLGGFGVMTMHAPGELAASDPTGLSGYEKVREQIFQDAPWTVWIMAVFVVLAIVVGGIYWARSRDPRRERGFVSWIVLPLSFTLMGTVAIALNMLMFSGSMLGEQMDLTMRMSWLNVAWFVAMGVAMEIVARIFRPKSTVLQDPPRHPGPPPVAGHPSPGVAHPSPGVGHPAQGMPYGAPFAGNQGSAHAGTAQMQAPAAPSQNPTPASSSQALAPENVARTESQVLPDQNTTQVIRDDNPTQTFPTQNSETETHND